MLYTLPEEEIETLNYANVMKHIFKDYGDVSTFFEVGFDSESDEKAKESMHQEARHINLVIKEKNGDMEFENLFVGKIRKRVGGMVDNLYSKMMLYKNKAKEKLESGNEDISDGTFVF